MCGIVGIISSNRDEARQKAISALDTMLLRGPDGDGLVQADDVTLGHRRLSIIGIANGQQPIASADGSIIIVCNGELYNYKHIKQKQCANYPFRTESDSEILIPLYLRYGIEGMMEYVEGEFAFLLYDHRLRMLYAVRDRFGIKPLCWYKDEEKIVIASKAKAVMSVGVDAQWDEVSLRQSLTMQYQPTDRTYWRGIHQLCPGHILAINYDRQVTDLTYWDMRYLKEISTVGHSVHADEASYIEEFREHLVDAVRKRLVSDVPICCHLSGGIDSSTVAGIMHHLDDSHPVHCFSIVFPQSDEEYDEQRLAQETVRQIGGVHHLIEVSQKDILTNLKDAVYHSEGLAVNGHLSCKYLLNREIRKAGFKVAMTGEGADECLAGYSHLRQDMYALMPADQRELLNSKLYATNLGITGTEIASGMTLDCTMFSQQLGFTPSFIAAKASIGYKVYSLLSDDTYDEFMRSNVFADLVASYDIEPLQGVHPVNQSLYFWNKLTLCNYILGTLGDGCEMASSIEGRLPFLDHHLFEFAASLPMDMKIHGGTIEKYILKEAARPFITENVYNRQKHPFQAPPLTRYFSKSEFDEMYDTLTSRQFQAMNIFNIDKVKTLLARMSQMDILEQTIYEPVVMLMMTLAYMNQTITSRHYGK